MRVTRFKSLWVSGTTRYSLRVLVKREIGTEILFLLLFGV